jgi:hypothetical protein
MKAGDIINWPPDVKFAPIRNMETMGVKKLNELAKKDLLDFTPEFLTQIKIIKNSGSELRADFTKYLADKLARKVNVSSIKIPWSKMKAEDIINWPSDLKFNRIAKMRAIDLKKLHDLVKQDLLDFTPEFISQFKILNDSVNGLRSYVAKYLADKLAKKLNISRIQIPWSNMKPADIINWPSGVKFERIAQMDIKVVQKLNELAKEDLLDFTPEFISQFKIMKDSVDKLRADFTKYLADKLARKLNISRIQIPWSKMKPADIINWPPDVKFKRIAQMNANDLKKLHELVKQDLLDFTPEFLKLLQSTSAKLGAQDG